MHEQTVTRGLSRLRLDRCGTDPHPRQPAPMPLQRADKMLAWPERGRNRRRVRCARERTGVAVALGVILAVTTLVVAAQSEQTVTGDHAAWAEVRTAYKKLQTLAGYRMRVATGQSPDMTFEVAPPASVRMTVPAGNGVMEVITVHGQSRVRTRGSGGAGPWQCQGAPSIEFPGDPAERIQGTVHVSRGGDTAIAGAAVRTYIYRYATTVQGQVVNVQTTLYVGAQTGLPRRAVTLRGGSEVAIDFYDFGTRIDIPLPPCPGGSLREPVLAVGRSGEATPAIGLRIDEFRVRGRIRSYDHHL